MSFKKFFELLPKQLDGGNQAQDLPATATASKVILDTPSEPTHEHVFQIIRTTYAPPRRDGNIPQSPTDLMANALLGVTQYLWQCSLCPEQKRTSLLGSEHPQLDDILDKVDSFGSTFVQRTGLTYVVQRYAPQPQGTVAIR